MKHPNIKHTTTTASQRLCPAGLPHPGRHRGSSAPRGTPGGRTHAVGSPSRCWSPSARPRSSRRHPRPPAGSHPGGGTAAVSTEPEQRHRKSRAKALQVALGMGLGLFFVLFFSYWKQFLPSSPVGVKLMHAEDEMGEEPVGWVLWGNAHGGP